MKPHNPWPAFVVRTLLAMLAVILLGWFTGRWLLMFLLGALAAVAWNLVNLRWLEHWLRLGRKLEPPQSVGLWGAIFDGLHRMRKRARDRDKQRRKLVRNYRDSVRAMPDATVVMDLEYHVEWCNQAARELLGLQWPRDEGQLIGNIFRRPEFVSFLAQPSDRARMLTLRSPVDARLWLELRLVPYAKKRHLLLARDVTALKRLETMRRDFVANVSHELRTPLTVIYGLAENLDEETAAHPELARSVQLLHEQTRRMKNLVDDLLMLSRLETDDRPVAATWVDVPGMLAKLAEEARLLSGQRDHQVTLEAVPGLLLQGNEQELHSAFANLVFNAVHYTPAGGQVDLRWHGDESGAHFEVRDNGIGIEPQHIERLTERFYRVDKGRAQCEGGSGLGLAIVKHVLLRHSGRLDISSQPGQGSMFTCSFPDKIVRRPAPAAAS